MKLAFTIMHMIVCVLLVVIVLAQEGKDPGLRGIVGSSTSDSSESFFNRNGGSTKKSIVSKFTATLAVLLLITTMTLVLLP